MSTFRQFWGKLFSSSKKPADAGGQPPAASPEELEREISAISGESHALAEEVHQVRSDFERSKDEDHRKLAKLELLGSRFETVREADSRKILDLEHRLAALESERKQTRDQARALEAALAETTALLEKTDLQVKNLQVDSVEQAKQFKVSLAEAGSRLEATDNHVRELEDRLTSERQDYLNTIHGMLERFSRQDLRMNWTMSVAGAALLLGTVAGVILIWEMQKNSRLLTGMSRDIKDLVETMDGRLSLQHEPQEEQLKEQPQLSLPAIPAPVTRAPVAAQPESSTTPEPRSAAASSRTTARKPASNPYFLGSASDLRGRPTTREGKRDPTRGDANNFFEENAKVEGVVSLPSGVQYRVVAPGSGKSPLQSDKIMVAYVGIKVDGTIFDETHSSGEPATFSMNELLPGWQEVLLKMEEGAEFELYVPPKLSTRGGVRKRGVLGYEPRIYLIELLEVFRDGVTVPDMPEK